MLDPLKYLLYVSMLLTSSCQLETQSANVELDTVARLVTSVNQVKKESKDNPKGMANPILLAAAGGADIGRLFNAYYRVGQQNNMYPFIDSQTKKKFSKEKVLQLLTKLDFGYDIRLSGASNNNPNYILTYTCQIAQTKVIKQLKVIVENDTARIVPKDLMKGFIFQ